MQQIKGAGRAARSSAATGVNTQGPGYGVALIAGALLAVVLLLALIGLVATGWEPLRAVDLNIVRSLNLYISGHRVQLQFWTTVSVLFGPVVLPIAVLLAAALLWWRGRRRGAAQVAVAMIGAASLSSIVKMLVGRARPVPMNPIGYANGYSFPSGHSLSSMVVIGVALFLLLPAVSARWKVPLVAGAVLLAAAVGFSRLILGVHFFSDVLGSWLIGGAWLLVLLAGFRRTPRSPQPGPVVTDTKSAPAAPHSTCIPSRRHRRPGSRPTR